MKAKILLAMLLSFPLSIHFSNLQFLLLRDLPRVYKKTEVLQYLKSSLPKCDICYPDSNIE